MTIIESGVSFTDILAARDRLASYAHRTPVMTCRTVDELAGRRVFFKCENFQRVGAFKFRGAGNAVMKLPPEIAARGVVTHSSGNHAQALALAARLRGIAAHIVMPRTAPAVKKRAVAGYGAMIYECEPTLAARESAAAEVIARTGATLIHPYDHPDVIAGQGTCVLELMEQASALQGIEGPSHQGIKNMSRDREGASFPSPPAPLPGGEGRGLDAIIAPVGGGGLMSGTCLAVRGCQSSTTTRQPIRLFGAEPAGADDAARSLAAGRLIPQTGPRTIADGLLTSLSERTFGIISTHLERIFTVTDDEIIRAMRLVWERMKIIIEPSSAAPVAAILSEAFRSLDGIDSIGVILSGGNVDLDHLPWAVPRS